MSEKSEVRKYYKERRDAMAAGEAASLSERICAHIIDSSLFCGAERIYAYAPLGNEVDVMPVADEARRQGKKVAFPKVFGDEMRYFEVADPAQLEKGAFGVREPSEAGGAVPADWREGSVLVLVPGIAFDRTGVRMGFGKGYYDRHFAERSGFILMGVTYMGQVAKRLPAEEHDLLSDYLATEGGVFSCPISAKQLEKTTEHLLKRCR